jgi:uncharacterized protein YaiI (UPF0178 family)
MRILVDADACPVKGIIVSLAKPRGIPVVMFTDTAHELDDGYSIVVTVGCRPDGADYALLNALAPGDIAVTQDFGLAAMVLGKGARAVNQNGLIYTADNIDSLLLERHIGQKARRSGARTKGPPRRTREDDERFRKNFLRIISVGC